jgi:Toprim-like
VTAANGVEGFGPDHWALFRESNVKRVLLAFDADPAGDKAAVKLSAQMIGEDMEVLRVEFRKGSMSMMLRSNRLNRRMRWGRTSRTRADSRFHLSFK